MPISVNRLSRIWRIGRNTLSLLLLVFACSASAAKPSEPFDPSELANSLASRIPLSVAEQRWLGQHPTIRVRVGAFPPYHMWDKGAHGISVDYLRLACAVYGIECQFIQGGPWTEAIERLHLADGFDLILSIKRTPRRAQQVLFTQDYLNLPWVIFTRSDAPFISDLDDLKGKSMSIERGFVLQRLIAEDYPEIQQLLRATPKGAMEALSKGQADAYVGNLTVGTYLINRWGYNNIKVAAPTPFGDLALAMAVRPDWPELTDLLDRLFAALTPQEHSELTNPWISVRYEYGVDWPFVRNLIALISVVGLLIMFVIGIWNRRLHREIRKRREAQAQVLRSHAVLQCIDELREQFIKDPDPFSLFPKFLQHLQRLTQSEYGLVADVLLDETDGSAYLKVYGLTSVAWDEQHQPLFSQTSRRGFEFRNLDNLLGLAVTSGEPVIANDAANDPRGLGFPAGHPQLDNFVAIPVHFGEMLVGEVCLANRSAGYDKALLGWLTPIIAGLGQIIVARWDRDARLKAEKELRLLATTDSLTGVANRRVFKQRVQLLLASMARYPETAVLIMFDIDYFKRVNDQHGHDAGDHVLVELVALVKAMVRDVDLLVRWGGEEFMLLLPQTDEVTGKAIAERIRDRVASHAFGLDKPVTISLGITLVQPNDTEHRLASRVDRALYQAKRDGRNRVVFVAP